MKSLLMPLVALVSATAVRTSAATYTWKGGAGRWDDSACWTADDGAADGYPHDDAVDTACFPADVEANVTIPDGTSVSNLFILAENSRVRFVATAGCTNAMTYRALRTLDATGGGTCGTNAVFALDRVKLCLKIDDEVSRLFGKSTADSAPVNVRKLDGPKDGSTIRLTNGAYFSLLTNLSTGKDTIAWEISGGAELHATTLHLGGGSVMTLDDGYLTVWNCFTDSFAFDGGTTIAFKGTHPRFVYGRIPSAYPFSDGWNAAVGKKVPFVGTLAFHLPDAPYEQAPFGNSGEKSESFPGGAFKLMDNGETDLSIPEDALKVTLADTAAAREAAGSAGLRYDLLDWSGLSWKETRLSIQNATNILVKGLRRVDAVETTVLDEWAQAGITAPQRWGVRIRRPQGVLFIVK